jgi:hypothetical protein
MMLWLSQSMTVSLVKLLLLYTGILTIDFLLIVTRLSRKVVEDEEVDLPEY